MSRVLDLIGVWRLKRVTSALLVGIIALGAGVPVVAQPPPVRPTTPVTGADAGTPDTAAGDWPATRAQGVQAEASVPVKTLVLPPHKDGKISSRYLKRLKGALSSGQSEDNLARVHLPSRYPLPVSEGLGPCGADPVCLLQAGKQAGAQRVVGTALAAEGHDFRMTTTVVDVASEQVVYRRPQVIAHDGLKEVGKALHAQALSAVHSAFFLEFEEKSVEGSEPNVGQGLPREPIGQWTAEQRRALRQARRDLPPIRHARAVRPMIQGVAIDGQSHHSGPLPGGSRREARFGTPGTQAARLAVSAGPPSPTALANPATGAAAPPTASSGRASAAVRPPGAGSSPVARASAAAGQAADNAANQAQSLEAPSAGASPAGSGPRAVGEPPVDGAQTVVDPSAGRSGWLIRAVVGLMAFGLALASQLVQKARAAPSEDGQSPEADAVSPPLVALDRDGTVALLRQCAAAASPGLFTSPAMSAVKRFHFGVVTGNQLAVDTGSLSNREAWACRPGAQLCIHFVADQVPMQCVTSVIQMRKVSSSRVRLTLALPEGAAPVLNARTPVGAADPISVAVKSWHSRGAEPAEVWRPRIRAVSVDDLVVELNDDGPTLATGDAMRVTLSLGDERVPATANVAAVQQGHAVLTLSDVEQPVAPQGLEALVRRLAAKWVHRTV